MTFRELTEQHDTAQEIPNDVLYQWLQDNYTDITNECKLGVDRIPKSPLGIEVRRRCKTDLMWLARYFTWATNPASDNGSLPFVENIFDEQYYGIFAKLFVKKDDTKPLRQQSEVKTRILLWPRGGAKSTFDHVDTVQWILNFPNIRIMYLTAEVSLAEGFVGEIKGHFYFKETPSLMNLFWPEFCVEDGKSGPADEFVCPVYAAKKTGRKEPTVYASSVGKNKAGRRYELIKADDAVSDVNSETSIQCEKISKSLFLAEKLLALGRNGGFYVDYIGTRYADEDHYGILLEQNIGEIETTEGQGWVFMENKTTSTNILIGRAIQIKPEVVQKLEMEGRAVTYKEAGPDGCVFLLPYVMDFKWCMKDFAKDEKSFEGQRNQNPRPASSVTFDRPLLLRSTVPYTEMPTSGVVSQVWDFAFSKEQKKGSDYTTGCSIMWCEREEINQQTGVKTGNKVTVGFIQEIVRNKFNHRTLAEAVVNLAEKYQPFIVGVENVGGAHFLTDQIRAEAVRRKNPKLAQLCSSVDWFAPDNQQGAKKVRMAALYPWLIEGRLKFFNGCHVSARTGQVDMETVYSEFERCLTSHKRDDIPDVIAMQMRYAPRAVIAIVENNEAMMTSYNPSWNLTFEEGSDPFGRLGYAPAITPFQEDSQSDYEVETYTHWQFS